jgi:NAD(P)-dependent dehydrogenase (short-subunit alcohol dehydrogenase family)
MGGGPRADIAEALAGLGARIEPVPELDGFDDARVGEWARSRGPFDALVYAGGARELEDLLADAWVAVREVAVGALIPGERGGKIVLIPPRGDPPAQAGFENLARTLSVEWARHGVTVVTVASGAHSVEADLAEVVSYLVSVAGDYFSGTRLDVGLVERPRPRA